MVKKIMFDNTEYDYEKLSENARVTLTSLRFSESRINELSNMHALLQRAKKSYIDSLKKEIISDKAGFLIEDD